MSGLNGSERRLPGWPSISFKDYYRVLGAPPKATDEKSRRLFAPSRAGIIPMSPKDKKTAEEKFREFKRLVCKTHDSLVAARANCTVLRFLFRY